MKADEAAAISLAVATVETSETPAVGPTSHRRWTRWALGVAIVVTLGVEIALAGPYVANTFSSLRHVDAAWIVLAIMTQVSSMMALVRVERRMLAAGGAKVSIFKMATLVWAANAVNATLPAGSALSWQYGYRRLRKWGATVPAAGFTLLASGVLSMLTFAVLLVIGAASAGLPTLIACAIALVALATLILIIRRRRPDGLPLKAWLLAGGRSSIVRAYRIARRSPQQALAGYERFVTDLTAIRPRRRDWAVGLGLAAMNWIADFGCLLACLAAVDTPRWTVFLALVAFLAGKSASSVTFLPGGLGVVDAAMVVALTAGGVPTAGATAGVVVYRLISLVLVVSIGWVAAGVSWLVERRVVPAIRERVEEVIDELPDVDVLPVALADAAIVPRLAPDGSA